MSDQWSERLSEYLDGQLPSGEARRLEAHLDSCDACRRTLEELRAVVARARALEDRPPPRDLWPEIEAELVGRLGGGGRADVVPLEAARRRGTTRARRVALSIPQLSAAAVALLLLGGAATWTAAPTLRGPGEERAASGAAVGTGPLSAVSADAAADPARAREMAALEEALAAHRDRLDPNTVRIVEKNLAIIDRAIRESRAALAVDPGNPFLEEHLEGAVERRLDYLREATRLLRTS